MSCDKSVYILVIVKWRCEWTIEISWLKGGNMFYGMCSRLRNIVPLIVLPFRLWINMESSMAETESVNCWEWTKLLWILVMPERKRNPKKTAHYQLCKFLKTVFFLKKKTSIFLFLTLAFSQSLKEVLDHTALLVQTFVMSIGLLPI